MNTNASNKIAKNNKKIFPNHIEYKFFIVRVDSELDDPRSKKNWLCHF